MTHKKIIIGTRGSPLALIQAQLVEVLLLPHQCTIRSITTRGDQILDQPLSSFGGKGLFCKEIDKALLNYSVDIAVHSAKDMPTTLPEGLKIGAILEREDPRDAWVSPVGLLLKDLPENAYVGTASLRRKVQLLQQHPTLKIDILRGNIPTRLEKIKIKSMHGTLLAVAGLKRLEKTNIITEILSTKTMLPAVGQGAIAILCRQDDQDITKLLSPLNHIDTSTCLSAERHMLKLLDGSCTTPIAGFAYIKNNCLTLEGLLATNYGGKVVRHTAQNNNPIVLGETVAMALLEKIR